MWLYIIFVYDDVDPEVLGPYISEEVRNNAAFTLRKKFGKDHGIYPLNIDGLEKPSIEAYSDKFFMEMEA